MFPTHYVVTIFFSKSEKAKIRVLIFFVASIEILVGHDISVEAVKFNEKLKKTLILGYFQYSHTTI